VVETELKTATADYDALMSGPVAAFNRELAAKGVAPLSTKAPVVVDDGKHHEDEAPSDGDDADDDAGPDGM
jgi:hypothetical protein